MKGKRPQGFRLLRRSLHDAQYAAEDAAFTIVPTGEEIRGREAISRYPDHFYHESFDARAEEANTIFGDGKGTLEAQVVGTHTGEFAGIPATGREIRVPLCVTLRRGVRADHECKRLPHGQRAHAADRSHLL